MDAVTLVRPPMAVQSSSAAAISIFAGWPPMVVRVPDVESKRLGAPRPASLDQSIEVPPEFRWRTAKRTQLDMLPFAEVWQGADMAWSLKKAMDKVKVLTRSKLATCQEEGYCTWNSLSRELKARQAIVLGVPVAVALRCEEVAQPDASASARTTGAARTAARHWMLMTDRRYGGRHTFRHASDSADEPLMFGLDRDEGRLGAEFRSVPFRPNLTTDADAA